MRTSIMRRSNLELESNYKSSEDCKKVAITVHTSAFFCCIQMDHAYEGSYDEVKNWELSMSSILLFLSF